MTQDDYLIAYRQIEKEALDKKFELSKEFIRINNPYKKGDVISDHYKTIEITGVKSISNIGTSIIPCAVYKGIVLKKDGTPAKNQSDNTVYATNIKKDEA